MRLEASKKFHHTIPAYCDVGGTGVLLAPRFGIGESPSSVNTDENWLLRTSASPLASPTVLRRFTRTVTFFVLDE